MVNELHDLKICNRCKLNPKDSVIYRSYIKSKEHAYYKYSVSLMKCYRTCYKFNVTENK